MAEMTLRRSKMVLNSWNYKSKEYNNRKINQLSTKISKIVYFCNSSKGFFQTVR